MDKEYMLFTNNGMIFNLKKKEITPFDSTWMNLENIILSELSQTPEGKNTA